MKVNKKQRFTQRGPAAPPVEPQHLAAAVARLRGLAASAGEDDLRSAAGEDPAVVAAAARELGRVGDDAALAALAALTTVPAFTLSAVEALSHVRDEAAAHILQQVAAAATSKEIGKAARRALHALAGQGLDIALPPPSGSAVFRPPATTGVAWSGALAGPIDADGSRSLLLGQSRLPIGAASAVAVVNEHQGLLLFQVASLTHRQQEKEWQIFLDERPETLSVEIPFHYAQWLLGEAADQMTAVGQEVPEDYTAWLEFTEGRPTDLSPLLIYQAAEVDPASPPFVALNRRIALLEEPEIEPWTLPFDDMVGYGAELLGARNSAIVLSETAQADRERHLVGRAANEMFTPELRRLYKRRLEETALLFLHSDRSEQAQAALATASAFGDNSLTAAEIPFATALTLRAIETAAEIAAPTTAEGQEARTVLYSGHTDDD